MAVWKIENIQVNLAASITAGCCFKIYFEKNQHKLQNTSLCIKSKIQIQNNSASLPVVENFLFVRLLPKITAVSAAGWAFYIFPPFISYSMIFISTFYLGSELCLDVQKIIFLLFCFFQIFILLHFSEVAWRVKKK